MGIFRENGYSASVEAFLVVGNERYRVAKSNGFELVLAEECELALETDADLLVIIDGSRESKRIVIKSAVSHGERIVQYVDRSMEVPF